MKPVLKFLVSIIVPQLAGVFGALFTYRAVMGWYQMLQKPALNPPAWVFGPVWTTLYLLMGIAAFLVWQKGWSNPAVQTALVMFIVQLVLNATWSVMFFGLHSPRLGLINIIALIVAIVATIALFARVSRVAAWLLAPYLLWVGFATYLNFAIWSLN